jgi:protein-tyrosine phosphatase
MAGVRIAMVCLGNICRSPMAEAVATAMIDQAGLSGEVVVESFGTGGYHAGEAADPKAVAALRRRGWPADGHRARRIRAADVERADLVLCADRSNVADLRRISGDGAGDPTVAGSAKIRLLRSYDPTALSRDQDVPDPWGGGDAEFDLTLSLIERACRGLVDDLARSLRRGGRPRAAGCRQAEENVRELGR